MSITASPPRTAIAHVLLVDDHALVRAGFRALVCMLQDDCRVSEAGDYADAVQVLESGSVDLALVDLDLRAAHSGLDVLDYIRVRGLGTQVLMLSATDSPELVLRCIDAGASGYLIKGEGDVQTLSGAIATVLAGGIHLPRSVLVATAPSRRTGAGATLQDAIVSMAPRMREVLYFLCQGLTNKAIAARMGISEGTVRKNYVSELLRLFEVTRRTELMMEIHRRGLQVPKPMTQRDTSH